MRCLAKDLKNRFQRAGEVRSALETLQSATIVSEPRREELAGPRTLVLRGIQHLDVKNGDVLLLLDTTTGAFLARSKSSRKQWDVAGPYFHGHAVYSLAYDNRGGRHRLWASTSSPLWGTFLRSSDDFGKTWTNPLEANIKFPPESGLSLKNIWKIALAAAETPDKLYCGVEPAALFESQDAGESWSHFRGRRLPHRRRRPDLASPQPRNPCHVHARAVSGVRAMRTQDRAACRPAGTSVPAKPLGFVSVR